MISHRYFVWIFDKGHCAAVWMYTRRPCQECTGSWFSHKMDDMVHHLGTN